MFRDIERSFPSLSFLLPNRRVFGDDVLLETPHNKYTPYNLDKLMIELGRPNVIPMWKDTRSLMDPFEHPGTDIVCVVGIGFNTMRKLVLTNDALIDGKYRKQLRRRKRSPRYRQQVEMQEDDTSRYSLNMTKINELYDSIFNLTSYYNENYYFPDDRMTTRLGDGVADLEGRPRNRRITESLIDQLRGKFNTMFTSTMRSFISLGSRLSQSLPLSFVSMRRMRDNMFNSKRFQYYWHVIENVLSPQLPKNAYDLKQGRYVFFSEGDSFVNIER